MEYSKKIDIPMWNFTIEKKGEPMWVILAISKNPNDDDMIEVNLGFASAETKEEAVRQGYDHHPGVPIKVEAFDLLTLLSSLDMFLQIDKLFNLQ